MVDVIIVGGGPAGLSAGLILGRSRRQVVICDAGQPRNAVSHAVHGFFSREGLDPAELRRIAREQLGPFGVEFRDGRVVTAVQGACALEIETEGGTMLVARRLLLAVGVVDVLPEIEGFQELWGTSVFSCPYCHGWEMRDQPVAVYGKGQTALDLALLLTAWTSDLLLCSDGPPDLSMDDEHRLSSAGIGRREERIVRLKKQDGQLEAIEFDDGSAVIRRAIFLRPKLQYRDALPKALGCALAENGAIQIDEHCQTSVPGVYAAGDCTGCSGQVVVMAAEGAKAGYAINRDLVQEDLSKKRTVFMGETRRRGD